MTETAIPTTTTSNPITPPQDAPPAETMPAPEMSALEAAKARAVAMYAHRAAAPRPTQPVDAQALAEAHTARAIHGALTTVGQARAAFERDKAGLYRADGTPRYGPDEHAEREGAIHASFDETITALQYEIGEALAAHQSALEYAEQGDLLDALTPAERATAAATKVFVEENVTRLSGDELVTYARYALATADKPILYPLERALAVRLAAAAKAGHEGHPEQVDLTVEQRRQLADLRPLLREAIGGPERAQKAATARAALEKWQQVRRATVEAVDWSRGGRLTTVEAQLRATGRYVL